MTFPCSETFTSVQQYRRVVARHHAEGVIRNVASEPLSCRAVEYIVQPRLFSRKSASCLRSRGPPLNVVRLTSPCDRYDNETEMRAPFAQAGTRAFDAPYVPLVLSPGRERSSSSVEPWRATLGAGNSARAWDQFIEVYRRLIFAVIRRTVSDEDDTADIFAEVCADLSRDDLARLSLHDESHGARFSTWLVTVVHHIAIDWVRRRDGRRRVSAPRGLTSIQQSIFDAVVVEKNSYAEAYEIIVQKSGSRISFGAFLKHVTATFDSLERSSGRTVSKYFPGPPSPLEQDEPSPETRVQMAESADMLRNALVHLSADEQLAVQLFVVEELPAEAVARAVGWPNSKAVYNRVYRALATLRRAMEPRE